MGTRDRAQDTKQTFKDLRPSKTWRNKDSMLVLLNVLLHLVAFTETAVGGKATISICPPGWSHMSERCYKLFLDKKVWKDARATCQSYGGDLLKIENDSENKLIGTEVKKHDKVIFYFGLVKKAGEFQWIDDTPVNIFREVNFVS
ncbi:C-type lectin domain family 4 member A [Elysia marginata]|uniref:C-type lectin domain family 4 member A n=1 Tax=Elysia marginata TaxID=1093978 RepID=A0AAV4I8S9_9GAST|nr:C-type lectin domain family 4 member A [Elysia marginata]